MYDSPLLECLTPFFVEALEDSTESPEAVVAALADRIYRVCHCREPLRTRALGRDRAREREYVNALSGANGGTGPWHTAWIARGVEGDGRVEVEAIGRSVVKSPARTKRVVTVVGKARVAGNLFAKP